MKDEIQRSLPSFCLLLWVILVVPGAAGFVVDHDCADPGLIPDPWIAQVKSNLHVAYAHTSHGSQLVTGLNALESFPEFGDRYQWSDDGSAGLDLDDYGIPCGIPDLSQGDYIDPHGVTPWVTCTRDFLDLPQNQHVNVIMWSWCSIHGHDAQRYVDNMEILVAEYPDVDFVFMTGHAQGQGEDMTPDSVHYNNQLIRAHCAAHDRILFDFADIEAYDPDDAYYWHLNLWDNLDYDGGNWAVEWLGAHPGSELERLTTGEGVPGYDGCPGCSHSSSPSEARVNCVLKGRALWWLLARIAGWPGPDGTPTATPTRTPPPGTATPTPVPGTAYVWPWMPDTHFRTGDQWRVTAFVRNPGATGQDPLPLFVILDVHGALYWWPSFTETPDHGWAPFADPEEERIIVPEFPWPPGAGSAAGITWYGAMTNPRMTAIHGEWGSWTFGFSP